MTLLFSDMAFRDDTPLSSQSYLQQVLYDQALYGCIGRNTRDKSQQVDTMTIFEFRYSRSSVIGNST